MDTSTENDKKLELMIYKVLDFLFIIAYIINIFGAITLIYFDVIYPGSINNILLNQSVSNEIKWLLLVSMITSSMLIFENLFQRNTRRLILVICLFIHYIIVLY